MQQSSVALEGAPPWTHLRPDSRLSRQRQLWDGRRLLSHRQDRCRIYGRKVLAWPKGNRELLYVFEGDQLHLDVFDFGLNLQGNMGIIMCLDGSVGDG